MELSDLRTCDVCRGPIVRPPSNWFWSIRVSGALLTSSAGVEAVARVQGGPPPAGPWRQGTPEGAALARHLELVDPGLEVLVAADRDPTLEVRLLLCSDCYGQSPLATAARARLDELAGSYAQPKC